MIDLYALTSPNVQKIFIMLEETGLPYNMILVDVWAGDQFKPDFLKINPNAKIPAIVDHEGPGGKPYTVFESGAILMYLAEKSGKFIPKDTAGRYDTIQWMMIQMTGIGPTFGQFTHFSRFGQAGGEYSTSRFRTELLRLYDLMEKRLATTGAYLAGADYSIADIASFPWLRLYENHGLKADTHPQLARWVKAISDRDGVKKALEKVGKITSSRESATPDQLDRLFGRGRYARA